ncbi:hypothetical protein OIU78_019890 [Salix suchowensis]|nr:hypothetical protein OIU78_019890 [Salix suchowensis]
MTTPLLQIIILLILSLLLQSLASKSATPTRIQLPHPRSTALSVTDFGAIGDGIHYDTEAIQSTINSCPTSPPIKTCHVSFPPGIYLTATIHLKSNVVLNIQEGATLLGGTKLEDYPKEFNRWYVVLAENVRDVGITGGGVVDGQGLKFVKRFDERKNVMVWNVMLSEPAYWCLHIVQCRNTYIYDTVGFEQNLQRSKLGSASWFEFKGLVFDNISIVDSHRGLGLQIRDGDLKKGLVNARFSIPANVSDVTFSNINISTRYYDPSWWGRAEPIYVTTCPRHSCSKEGSISNLQFINITAKSENGVFLSGSKGGLLSNLRFINMNLTYSRWTDYTGGLVDYRPGCQGLVNHSAAGIIMEHIEGFEIENVNMRWSDYQNELWDNPLDFRPSTVNNISLRNFHSALYKQMK